MSFADNFPNIFKAIFMLWCPAFCCPDTNVYLAFSALTPGSSSLLMTTTSLHSIFSSRSQAGVSPAVSNLLCVRGPSYCHITRQILRAVIIMNPFVSGYSEYWTCQRLPLPPPPWLDSPSGPRPPQCWEFEPAIPASEWPKTHLDRAATGIGQRNITDLITGIIQAYTHFKKLNKFHGSQLQL